MIRVAMSCEGEEQNQVLGIFSGAFDKIDTHRCSPSREGSVLDGGRELTEESVRERRMDQRMKRRKNEERSCSLAPWHFHVEPGKSSRYSTALT